MHSVARPYAVVRPVARQPAPKSPKVRHRSHLSVPAGCWIAFAIVWIAAAVHPRDRSDWFLENLLTGIFVPLLVANYRRVSFSDRACIQLTIFALLHTVGSHYTYAEVPVGDWVRGAFGLQRNHYDRVVHFAFGLLLLRPLREWMLPNPVRMGRWTTSFLCLAIVAFWSMAYEVVEWLVAATVAPEAGAAYLGIQGDVWDAQKDMAIALVGAGLAVLFDRVPHVSLAHRRAT